MIQNQKIGFKRKTRLKTYLYKMNQSATCRSLNSCISFTDGSITVTVYVKEIACELRKKDTYHLNKIKAAV